MYWQLIIGKGESVVKLNANAHQIAVQRYHNNIFHDGVTRDYLVSQVQSTQFIIAKVYHKAEVWLYS